MSVLAEAASYRSGGLDWPAAVAIVAIFLISSGMFAFWLWQEHKRRQ